MTAAFPSTSWAFGIRFLPSVGCGTRASLSVYGLESEHSDDPACRVDRRAARFFPAESIFRMPHRRRISSSAGFPGFIPISAGVTSWEANGGLWQESALRWVLENAMQAGMLVDPDRRQKVETRSPIPRNAWAEPKHESLTPLWWLAEVFPKLRKVQGFPIRLPKLNLGHNRYITDGQELNQEALLRIFGIRRAIIRRGLCLLKFSPTFVASRKRRHSTR